MTAFDRYTRDTLMPAIANLLAPRDADRDEPRQHERAPSPCGAHCADSDGALCGEHDAACDAREEAARDEGRKMCQSAEQLYDHALIDAGAAGQSFARILAAVFRGDAVPALLIAQAREEFAGDVLEYLMKGGK